MQRAESPSDINCPVHGSYGLMMKYLQSSPPFILSTLIIATKLNVPGVINKDVLPRLPLVTKTINVCRVI